MCKLSSHSVAGGAGGVANERKSCLIQSFARGQHAPTIELHDVKVICKFYVPTVNQRGPRTSW